MTSRKRGRAYGRKGSTRWLVLEGRLIHAKGVVLGLGGDRGRRGVVVGGPAVTACDAVEVVSVVKTLLGLSAEGEGRDLSSDVGGRGAGHDGFARGLRGGISGG